MALAFPEAIELPHFDITSFRVRKKIFVTLDEKKNRVCVFLSLIDQSVFSAYDNSIIYPVPNKWGAKGATYIELKSVPGNMLKDALSKSYMKVAPEKTSTRVKKK